jgi:hypothetical protein
MIVDFDNQFLSRFQSVLILNALYSSDAKEE